MPFEYVPARKGLYPAKWSYTDPELEEIYDIKEDLEIRIRNELEVLKNLYNTTEDEYNAACAKRDAITDWDSPEAEEADDAAQELWYKLDAVDNWIDWLEEVLNSIE